MKHKDVQEREIYLHRFLDKNKFAIETACNLCCTPYCMNSNDYWQRIKVDFICFLYTCTATLAKWTNNIMRFVKMTSQKENLTEVEKFVYWFIHVIYKVDTFTDYEEIRKKVKREYQTKQLI